MRDWHTVPTLSSQLIFLVIKGIFQIFYFFLNLENYYPGSWLNFIFFFASGCIGSWKSKEQWGISWWFHGEAQKLPLSVISYILLQAECRWIELGVGRESRGLCACHLGGLIITKLCCYLVAKSCPTLYDRMDCSSQAPLVMGFPRQGYWSGLPFPSPYKALCIFFLNKKYQFHKILALEASGYITIGLLYFLSPLSYLNRNSWSL